LQQGYECTRRFLTEFISSSSSDNDIQPLNHCNYCHTADSKEHLSQNGIESSLNQTVYDSNAPELDRMSISYHGLNISCETPARSVECLSASEDNVSWCTAVQQLEISRGPDSSYSANSVVETQV